MKPIFIISGFGVPKDIERDSNYQYYLRAAFNSIYDDVAVQKVHDPMVILSGGKTDMQKPYRRTEATEMLRLFRTLKNRPFLRPATRAWRVITEPQSISAVENLKFALGILKSQKIHTGEVTFFTEWTRQARFLKLARRIFPKTFSVSVRGIDFDVSANRYLDTSFLKEKEEKAIQLDLWALKKDDNLIRHHELHRSRIAQLRKAGQAAHVQAVRDWWEEQMKTLAKEIKG